MNELVKEMTLENGGKVYFKAGPIHPYWTVNFESGDVPRKLKGQFQFLDDAVEAVKNYVERREKNKTTVTKKIVDKEKK